VNPAAEGREELLAAMTFANRVLGFVNAPALMQRVVAQIQGSRVDIEAYTRKRDLLCGILESCGYDFVRPAGAFYLFPRSPLPDDVDFVGKLQESLILAVPGSGFGAPGYFRLSYCVDDATITNAAEGFATALAAVS
ncbi:MAG: aminotransferase class I/II-fold pyridoxal phosphate-dependent enzyme, partial [Desulfosudaceae bacterium]